MICEIVSEESDAESDAVVVVILTRLGYLFGLTCLLVCFGYLKGEERLGWFKDLIVLFQFAERDGRRRRAEVG